MSASISGLGLCFGGTFACAGVAKPDFQIIEMLQFYRCIVSGEVDMNDTVGLRQLHQRADHARDGADETVVFFEGCFWRQCPMATVLDEGYLLLREQQRLHAFCRGGTAGRAVRVCAEGMGS